MYSSNTMYVGDGTWDATRNTFLLPNLVGLNFETMQYNGNSFRRLLQNSATDWESIGMGNRFRDLPQYHTLIKGHGIIATITFLFIVPAAILTARFYGRNPGWALRTHIYLQILTVALSTVLFILGWFAVGPSRSLTNPHHGIGLAIYVIILVQSLGGGWIYRREKGKVRRKLPVKLVMHQWLGRAVALLGIVQVPLGLTLYGSPKYTFILYALWMTFLLVLYFVLSYRAMAHIGAGRGPSSSYGGTGTIIEEKKKRSWLGPLAAGAGIAAILARRRSKKKERERSRSRSRSRLEVIPSRRGSRRDSGSYISEEKYEQHDEGGGFMSKLLKGGAILGAGALAKNWYDRRQKRKEEDEYTSVAPDTPSRRHGRHGRHDSVSSESISVHRMEEGRRPGAILPGPGDAVAAAAAISAAERPAIPRPTRPARRHSFDSSYYTDSLSAANSPSRRPQSTHKLRNSVIAGVGLGWAAKKWRDRSKRKEEDRLDQLEADHRIEEERRRRHGQTPTKYTGDGHPSSRRHGRRPSHDHSSDFSSVIEDVHTIRPGAIPPIPAALAGGLAGAALASGGRSSSHQNIQSEHPSNLPPPQPHFPQTESGSEQYYSSGGAMHRRHSSRRRREGEAAAGIAVAAGLAAEAEARRRRSRSRSRDYSQGPAVASPPVSVKVKMHGDKDRNVTLRRLTEQEAAAEREARRSSRRRRADSLSSLSGTDTNPASNRRRYRRDRREEDEIAAEQRAEAGMPPPAMAPLSPPNPAFAGGRKPKDSAYYSGRPESSGLGRPGPGSVGSPESHGTWSAMSPGSGSEDPAERRRRRRLERNQRPSGTVEFT